MYAKFNPVSPGSPVVIRERGCAKQVYSYQDLERGQWRTITEVVEETYQTGCVRDTEWAGSLASDTEWCYCDTDRSVLIINYHSYRSYSLGAMTWWRRRRR